MSCEAVCMLFSLRLSYILLFVYLKLQISGTDWESTKWVHFVDLRSILGLGFVIHPKVPAYGSQGAPVGEKQSIICKNLCLDTCQKANN